MREAARWCASSAHVGSGSASPREGEPRPGARRVRADFEYVDEALLREHLEWVLYPKLATDVDAVRRAIVAVAEGNGSSRITYDNGYVETAAMIVAVLDLEPVVAAYAEAIARSRERVRGSGGQEEK